MTAQHSPTDISPGQDDEARALRADIYALLAALLRTPPDNALREWLASLETSTDDIRFAQAWQHLANAAADSTSEELKRAHFVHLVGVIQGDVLPYASYYREGGLMEAPLVALRQELRTLNLERSPDVSEPEDHLAALCEVMAMLVAESHPHEAGFFHRHLAPWATDCARDLAAVASPFYAAIGALASLFFERERSQLQTTAHPSSQTLGMATPDVRRQPQGAGDQA